MEKKPFDFEAFKKEAAARLKSGQTLLGKEGVFTPLLKEFLEEAMVSWKLILQRMRNQIVKMERVKRSLRHR
jgi:hypothetical protein